jgi:predicted dehydrogenase
MYRVVQDGLDTSIESSLTFITARTGFARREKMSKKYNVAIVGAGSIGASKPDKYDSPQTKNILTHAHAIYNNPRTELMGIVDSDEDKAMMAASKWGCDCLSNLNDIPDMTDIIIVATPTETHYDILHRVVQFEPRIVIAEKPVTYNKHQAQIVRDLYERSQIPIAVNYTRRYVPEYAQVRDMIKNERFGKAVSCQFYYTRGLKRDGSHAIDLFNYFFGEFKRGQIFKNHCIHDFSKHDPTFAAYFSYEKCPHIFMFPHDGRNFAIFEMSILFEKGRITFEDHGLRICLYDLTVETVYDQTKILNTSPSKICNTQLPTGLAYLINNVVNFLDKKVGLFCTIDDALSCHYIYEQMHLI